MKLLLKYLNSFKNYIVLKIKFLIAKILGRDDYESFSYSKVNELKRLFTNWSNNIKTIEKIANVYEFINKPKKIIQELYDYIKKIYFSTF